MRNKNREQERRRSRDNLRVTVAIPCYNAEKYISSLLTALFMQSRQPDEILIIDDGSSDRTKETAAKFPVKIITHSTNKGLACARNSATLAAAGDIIVFFDADTVPGVRTIEQMLGAYGDPKTAGVGGQELFLKAPRKIDLWRNLFWRQTHGAMRNETARMLMGLCASYRREALIKAGGFDEKYNTHGEDVDMGLRLFHLGHRLVYVPEIGVLHHRKDTLKSILALTYRHAYWQSRAFRRNGLNPLLHLKESIRWLFVSTGSSLVRHRDPVLALLSPLACGSAIAGRVMEHVGRNRMETGANHSDKDFMV